MALDKAIPFFTPIWYMGLTANFETELAFCKHLGQASNSVNKSNAGGFQSDNFNFEQVFPSIYHHLKPFIKEISEEIEQELNLTGAWLNINKKGDSNIQHCHPNSVISGVIYLQVNDNTGMINFKNPTSSQHYPVNNANPTFGGSYSISPLVNEVVFFPSYLEHYVSANMSDEDRISIAFNLA